MNIKSDEERKSKVMKIRLNDREFMGKLTAEKRKTAQRAFSVPLQYQSMILIVSRPSSYSAVIDPPIRSTRVRAIDNPSPVEWCAASTV